MELNNHQFLKSLVLLAALKQFEYQATNRLLLAASEEYGDSGTTQKKDVRPLVIKCLFPVHKSQSSVCGRAVIIIITTNILLLNSYFLPVL